MIYDPHDDSFCAKNLREEDWFEYQRSDDVLLIVFELKKAFEKELIGVISLIELMKIEIKVMINAGVPGCLIQLADGHWAAMAICMLSHGCFQKFPEEGLFRFYKSPHDQEPMYYNNIEYVQKPNERYETPVRKVKKPELVKPIQESLFG